MSTEYQPSHTHVTLAALLHNDPGNTAHSLCFLCYKVLIHGGGKAATKHRLSRSTYTGGECVSVGLTQCDWPTRLQLKVIFKK